MITRAQIRRQLRKEGGIMNAVPRQRHFSGGTSIGGGTIQGTPMGSRTGYWNPFKRSAKFGYYNGVLEVRNLWDIKDMEIRLK